MRPRSDLPQPARETSKMAIMIPASKIPPEAGAPPIHVWLIEDHIDFRNTVARVLARQDDLQVSTFSNCEDALEQLHAGRTVHVILLDIGLPGISGRASCRER